MFNTFLHVLGGTGFTFLMTILGAAVVFFFRGAIEERMNRAFLGFASGVMIAASVWSLLIPSLEQSGEQGMLPWLPPAAGFAAGILVFFTASIAAQLMPWLLAFAAGAMIYVVADELIPQAQPDESSNAGTISVMTGFLIMMVLDVALG